LTVLSGEKRKKQVILLVYPGGSTDSGNTLWPFPGNGEEIESRGKIFARQKKEGLFGLMSKGWILCGDVGRFSAKIPAASCTVQANTYAPKGLRFAGTGSLGKERLRTSE